MKIWPTEKLLFYQFSLWYQSQNYKMFSAFTRNFLYPNAYIAAYFALSRSPNFIGKFTKKTILLSPFYMHGILTNWSSIQMNTHKYQQYQNDRKQLFRRFIRSIQLFAIFLPSIITLPLVLLPVTRKIWINILIWSIKKAGVVWIKLFQYLSHRRDVLGQDLAQSFAPLRQFSPQHTFKDTQNIFRKIYGVNIEDYFEQFDKIPIASGSVSQVYKAKLRGQKVAIKIRHPNIQQNIQRDIKLVFGLSNIMKNISRLFQIPVNQRSLTKLLTEQIHLTKQLKNLQKFTKYFKYSQVQFPKPFTETSDQVLIMSFMEGKPITNYKQYSKQMNKSISRVCANAFFQMLIVHNFIHADCHGGNIFINVLPKHNSLSSSLSYYYNKLKDYLWFKAIRYMLDTQSLKTFCDAQQQENFKIRNYLYMNQKQVKVIMLDVGMVLEPSQKNRNYLLDFLTQVIKGDPQKCAKMIYNISKFGGKQINPGQYPTYIQDLENMFQMVRNVQLQNLQGMVMLKGMLQVIRKHRMKLDGQFATLFTNILTLQAILKNLDPNINILRCAVPYLPYK